MASGAGPGEIPLPAPAPPAARTDPLALLGPDPNGDLPSRAPGPVADDEVVRVGLAPDGSVRSVRVDQRLTIAGVGDFDMKVLGPALDVVGREGASPQPGLRNGTVIWQGFSPGTKVLESTVTLQTDFERTRLPVRVEAGGSEVVIANSTAVPVSLSVGPADAGALRALVAAVRGRLAAGVAPVPGADRLPSSLPAGGPVTVERRVVQAPMRVQGSAGGVPFDVLLPSAAAPDGRLVVSRGAGGSEDVRFTVTPALPEAAALPDNAGVVETVAVLAQAARLPQYQAYEGVTVPGPSTARYEYGPELAAAAVPVGPAEQADWATVGLAAVAALLLAGVAGAAWARS